MLFAGTSGVSIRNHIFDSLSFFLCSICTITHFVSTVYSWVLIFCFFFCSSWFYRVCNTFQCYTPSGNGQRPWCCGSLVFPKFHYQSPFPQYHAKHQPDTFSVHYMICYHQYTHNQYRIYSCMDVTNKNKMHTVTDKILFLFVFIYFSFPRFYCVSTFVFLCIHCILHKIRYAEHPFQNHVGSSYAASDFPLHCTANESAKYPNHSIK